MTQAVAVCSVVVRQAAAGEAGHRVGEHDGGHYFRSKAASDAALPHQGLVTPDVVVIDKAAVYRRQLGQAVPDGAASGGGVRVRYTTRSRYCFQVRYIR